jgi:hypothetical protein
MHFGPNFGSNVALTFPKTPKYDSFSPFLSSALELRASSALAAAISSHRAIETSRVLSSRVVQVSPSVRRALLLDPRRIAEPLSTHGHGRA